MGIKYVHLIRHGQYNMDQVQKKYGHLTALGRYQAMRVGKRLNEHDVSIIHVSTMTRAQETGQLILSNLDGSKSRNCKLLVEGIPEFPEKWIRQKKLKKSGLRATKTRFNQAYKKYFRAYKGKGEKHEALVCHGNVIRYFVAKALGVDTNKWINFDILQGSISTISIDSTGRQKLVTFGEIGHIAPQKRTFL